MKKIVLLFWGVGLMVGCLGCGDDDTPTGGGGQALTFPHTVGSVWTYAYIRYENQTTVNEDTVDVVVIGDTVWDFRYAAAADVQVTVLVDDTIKLGWPDESIISDDTPLHFSNPVDTGFMFFGSSGAADTTTLSGPMQIKVAAGTFTESYTIERRVYGLEESEQTRAWVVPHVGVVWYSQKISSLMVPPYERKEVWELIDYNLK